VLGLACIGISSLYLKVAMGDRKPDDGQQLFIGKGEYNPDARIDQYKKEMVGTPEDLARQFHWAAYLTDQSFYGEKITSFCQKSKDELNLDSQTVIRDLDAARGLTTQFFNLFPSPSGKPEMNYHDPMHAQITEIVGVKLFLGALSGLNKDSSYRGYFQTHPDLAQRLVKTVAASFALHELDDWWKRKQGLEKIPPDIQQALTHALSPMDIHPGDVNRFVNLDDFKLPIQDSLDMVLAGTYEKICVEESGSIPGQKQSIFDSLSDNLKLRKDIITAIARCIRAADFMQILNPAYLQLAQLLDSNGTSSNIKTAMGALALAQEMQYYRPQAIGFSGWQKEGVIKPEIDWAKVGIGRKFYNDLAYPNINGGIHYMVLFDPDEYRRATEALETVQGKLS